ncbi:hypothetical protein ACP70R_021197 [Stipagrostis hirtigluma subsp. patula]
MAMATAHAHPDPPPFFLTPPPRHLAELRIDPPPSAVAFSAPCAARKRRCLLPSSTVRKRMLLELDPFEPAQEPAPAPTPCTPPPPPSRTPSPSPPPSPMASRAGGAGASSSSPAGEFSFGQGLEATASWAAGAGGVGNIFAFFENTQGQPATLRCATATGGFAFLTAPERPRTPTGPTARGGFAFAAASPERPVTPTGSSTSGGLSFLASPLQQPLTPTGSSATGGFFASLSSEPSLLPTGCAAAAPLLSPKPARTGATADSGGFAFFPTPGPTKETIPPAVLATPSFVFSAPRSPPPLRKSGGGRYKRPRQQLRRDAAIARRRSPPQWEWEEEEEDEEEQQFTPPPQKVAKTNASATGEASRSSIMSGSTARPCCAFFASPTKAGKQEANKACSEASRSPAGSRCTSAARPSSGEKASKPEAEVEVSSVAREPPTSPKPVTCSGAEVVVRVTCKCGVHKEFCFDHRQ